MPIIKDERIREGKRKRNDTIREKFATFMDDGRTIDYALCKIIGEYGLSESTIMQIIKRNGNYKD